MRYYVIGDEDAVLGFGMVGVPGRVAGDPATAEAVFREAVEDAENGIIIVTEGAADMMRELVDQYVFTRAMPLVVEIPDRRGRDEGRPGIREMVNQAIGITL